MRKGASDIRQSIKATYLGMIGEYRYDKVPVKELAARCYMARTTFYAHYEGVLDLLEDIESGLLSDLALYDRDKIVPSRVGEKTPPPDCFARWFDMCAERSFELHALTKPEGDPYFSSRLRARLCNDLDAMMADDGMGRFADQAPYVREMIGSSLVALMRIHVDRLESGQQTMSSWELAFLANATRIGYHTSYRYAPAVSDERLYGRSEEFKRMLR